MSDTPETELIPPPLPSAFQKAQAEVHAIIEEPKSDVLDPNDPRDAIIIAQIAQSKK